MRYDDQRSVPSRSRSRAEAVPLTRRLLPARTSDLLALGFAAAIAAAIAGNALVRQNGPHPAPMFAPAPSVKLTNPPPVPLARPQADATTQAPATFAVAAPPPPAYTPPPSVQQAAPMPAPQPLQLASVARGGNDELARLAARASGERVSEEPRERPATPAARPAQPKNIAALIAATESTPAARASAPSAGDGFTTRQTMAIEKGLERAGFNPGRIDGAYDRDLRAAIEAFERKHKWPITGQLSARLAKELGL